MKLRPKTLVCAWLALCCLFSAILHAGERPFAVVIPSHNNKDWCRKNLRSVLNQKYENYRVFYIADGPDDGTEKLAEQYIKKMGQEARVTLITNKNRNGYLACITQAINLCDKDEIVLVLDGNDWLANNRVLSYLNQVYSNPDVWMTYGQFRHNPDFQGAVGSPLPREVIDNNDIRHFGGAFTHRITFYAGLFHEIKKEDLLFARKFIRKAGLLAYGAPIMEMAGIHCHIVTEIHHIYGTHVSLNDHTSAIDHEAKMIAFLQSKKKYTPLDALPWKNLIPRTETEKVYAKVADIRKPTQDEYLMIQKHLYSGKRENIERLLSIENQARSLNFIGDPATDQLNSGVVNVNCSMEEKENCILLYSSFNRNFPRGVNRQIDMIKASDFKGHILYQIGGWPGLEDGALRLAHVPYAFKVAFFQEAKRKGYVRVLWMDSSIVPLKNLNDHFKRIKERGYLVVGNIHNVGPFFNPQAAAFFGLTHEQTYSIPSCAAGILGVDFSHQLGEKIIDWWHRAAYDRDAFFNHRADQNVLSVILYKLGISDFISWDHVVVKPMDIQDDTVFLVDWDFVHF